MVLRVSFFRFWFWILRDWGGEREFFFLRKNEVCLLFLQGNGNGYEFIDMRKWVKE